MAALPPMPTLYVIPSLPKATLPALPAMLTLPKAALQPSPAITLPTSSMTLPTAPTTLPKPTLRPYQALKILFAKPNIASHAHCPEGLILVVLKLEMEEELLEMWNGPSSLTEEEKEGIELVKPVAKKVAKPVAECVENEEKPR
ncbi:hypothetical protein RJ640_024813 [Escallonia rubra]|uniref:Uncharacterized protein n=1 Tax=Escallonia rubra TaxID=112253 RepID=A0AA88RB88_9ASTE|nr:hypothetical protein RJ640_024813 [Escallonia rubra]